MSLPGWRSRRRQAPAPGVAAVLLATPGVSVGDAAIDAAIIAAGGELILVLTVAKIYGTSLGLQFPGLLPTKREMQEQRDIVADAIARIKRGGGKARGEIVATRDNAKTFRRAALRYSVRHVVLVPAASGRLRRLVEGDPASSLRRRLGQSVEIQVAERSTSDS